METFTVHAVFSDRSELPLGSFETLSAAFGCLFGTSHLFGARAARRMEVRASSGAVVDFVEFKVV